MARKGRPAGDRDGCRVWSSGKRSPGLFREIVFATDPAAGSLKHRTKLWRRGLRRTRQARAEIARAFRDRGRRPGPPAGGLSWERVKTPRLAGSPDNDCAERSASSKRYSLSNPPGVARALRVPFIPSAASRVKTAWREIAVLYYRMIYLIVFASFCKFFASLLLTVPEPSRTCRASHGRNRISRGRTPKKYGSIPCRRSRLP